VGPRPVAALTTAMGRAADVERVGRDSASTRSGDTSLNERQSCIGFDMRYDD
jgi:hypothetical protein